MIEYALLFGLGFLTAILTAMLLAPAIHRRIVKFTEDRIMATMPVSPQELRAQKDMVRAEMAVAVARTGQDLKQERHKAATLSIRNDVLSQEASRLYGENSDLHSEVEDLKVQAGELRKSLRDEELRVETIRTALAATQHAERLKDARIDELLHRIQRLTTDVDNLKIDLVTRDTEAESFRVRINALRDERETLKADLRSMTQRTKDAELRLAREENRASRLEDKLNAEVSTGVDKDTVIERRVSEINRLKERLKSANAEARQATRAMKGNGTGMPLMAAMPRVAADTFDLADEPVEPEPPEHIMSSERSGLLGEEARNRANAVSEKLVNLQDDQSDDAMRAEIADIAAKMIAIVAQKEGDQSPIRPMIAGKQGKGHGGRVSLAERASKFLHHE